MKKIIISGIITLIFAFFTNYFLLPAWNVQSMGFWLYLLVNLLVFGFFSVGFTYEENSKVGIASFCMAGILLLVFLIASFCGSHILNSKKYSSLIGTINKANIEDYDANLDNVPLIDKDSSMLIANRELGSLSDVVSQFEINDSEQITVNSEPMRISVLQYGGFFKWLNNKNDGTPGYIEVNMTTQDATLVRVKNGVKYSPSEYFGRDINRYIHHNFPTIIFETPTAELDESGNLYWIASIEDHKIGLFGGVDISGVITVNAETGDIQKYDIKDIPDWIDNVYKSDLIMDQYDLYGEYQNGFWNSIFGQKGVTATTEGYNYIPQGNDNYIYTGITSVGSDESNIGFILVNKRTKEVTYYSQSGAEEYSAMSSAEGMVQDLGYNATFPLLLMIEGQPTYLLSLKDSGGLVKQYAMINVQKYQIVANGDTIQSCKTKYRELLKGNGTSVTEPATNAVSGQIEDIKEASKSGTTYYYVKLVDNDHYYSLSILDNEMAVLLKVGDSISINAETGSDNVIVSATLVNN